MRIIAAFLLIGIISSNLFSQSGIITGSVVDSKTREPLVGVNIMVNELENAGTASDIDGKFIIRVPVGSYSLRASLVGYTPVIKTDVIIKTGYEAVVQIQLSEMTLKIDEVTVMADYFDKSSIENNLSTITLGTEEIKRSPGSAIDFQRILQGMAGVSFSTDRTNELLVRGGAPDENLTILDNIEIHSTNHFPNEYNSGGAVNMVNIDLIQNIQFSTGGFISKYGNKLSSVTNITTREGTRNSVLDGNINISMAGFGGVLEGAINNGKGSWLFSARNSFLSLLKDAIGLSAVPVYNDMQFKLVYDLSSKHKLSLSVIYGNDILDEESDPDNSDYALAGKIDSVSLSIENIKQYQYAAGATLKSLWNNSFYSLFTLYHYNYHTKAAETEQFFSRNYNSDGDVFQSKLLNEITEYKALGDIGEVGVKTEFVWNIRKSQELNLGGGIKTDRFKREIYVGANTTRYDTENDGWATPDDIYIIEPSSEIIYNINLFDNIKAEAFVNNKLRLFNDRLVLNIGLRYDYFSYSGKGNISPRLSASYYIIPALTSLNFAYGEYYQTQNYLTYSDRYKSDINKNLKNTHSSHFVLGLEHIMDEGLKIALEGYYKNYMDIPVSEEFILYNDRTFRSEKYLNIGKQKSYGIDLSIQQKLAKSYYGTLAYSRMWSKFKDPRIGKEGKEYPSDYEYPHVLTIILGKRFSNLRDRLNEAPLYIKYLSYLLPFSNDMEISARWRYASGRVYTPRTFKTNEQYYEGEIRWSKGIWVSGEDINSARFPDYHRLDISFSSRYNFSKWSLSVYLSIENIYNRENVARYRYNADGSKEIVGQFSLFPVAGIEMEF